MFVSHTIAAPLNLRAQKLSTLLIVHTLFGQDLFVSLDGDYGTAAPICFRVDRRNPNNKLQCLHASELLCLSWLVCRAPYASWEEQRTSFQKPTWAVYHLKNS